MWVWPLVAALVLVFIGVWLRVKMEGATKQQIADMLQTILNANNEALHSWSVTKKTDAENLAEDDRVRELVAGLIHQATSSTQVQAALLTAPQLSALRAHLKPVLERRGFSGFMVLDTNFLVVASAVSAVSPWPGTMWAPSDTIGSYRPSAMLEQEAQIFGLRERTFPLSTIGSPQYRQSLTNRR